MFWRMKEAMERSWSALDAAECFVEDTPGAKPAFGVGSTHPSQ